jgi:hypothetical protein
MRPLVQVQPGPQERPRLAETLVTAVSVPAQPMDPVWDQVLRALSLVSQYNASEQTLCDSTVVILRQMSVHSGVRTQSLAELSTSIPPKMEGDAQPGVTSTWSGSRCRRWERSAHAAGADDGVAADLAGSPSRRTEWARMVKRIRQLLRRWTGRPYPWGPNPCRSDLGPGGTADRRQPNSGLRCVNKRRPPRSRNGRSPAGRNI